MKQYYLVKTKEELIHDNGKATSSTVEYLVDAVSVTDAEVSITKHLGGTINFEVTSVSISKIAEVVEK